MSGGSADIRPTFLDRLFLRMDRSGMPITIHWAIDVNARLDPTALAISLERAIREVPRLDSLVRRSVLRCARVRYSEPPGSGAPILVRCPGISHPDGLPPIVFDLERERPLKVFVLDGPNGGTRLFTAFSHSVTDAIGAAYFIRRWGDLYRSETTGSPPPPYQPARSPAGYRWLFREQTFLESLAAWARTFFIITDIADIFTVRSRRRCATIADSSHPHPKRLRHHVVRIGFAQMGALMRSAVARKTSPVEIILRATATASAMFWPPSEEEPFRVALPVDLRGPWDRDVANRAAGVEFDLEAEVLRDPERTKASISAALTRARGRTAAVRTIMRHGVIGNAPPIVVCPLIRDYMEKPENTFETFSFTAFDLLWAPVPEFGGHKVVDIFACGSVYPRPALRFNLCSGPQGIALCASYLDGVLRSDKIAALGERIIESLASDLA